MWSASCSWAICFSGVAFLIPVSWQSVGALDDPYLGRVSTLSASHIEVRMPVASRASYLEIMIDMRRTFDLGWG
jgi:hypothetical protein